MFVTVVTYILNFNFIILSAFYQQQQHEKHACPAMVRSLLQTLDQEFRGWKLKFFISTKRISYWLSKCQVNCNLLLKPHV